MKAVIQRVKSAQLCVDGKEISAIGEGLVVYYGVQVGDREEYIVRMAKKVANMRIFEDENGKMNLSALSLNKEILLVSQFTLLADCKRGNRPAFIQAETPDRANMFYNAMKDRLQEQGISVKMGVFGADMRICQVNDGPVTIVLTHEEI